MKLFNFVFSTLFFTVLFCFHLPTITAAQTAAKRNDTVYVDGIPVNWKKTFIDPENVEKILKKRIGTTNERTKWLVRKKKYPYLTAGDLDTSKHFQFPLLVIDGFIYNTKDTVGIKIEENAIIYAERLYENYGRVINTSVLVIRTKAKYTHTRLFGLHFLPYRERIKKFK